MNASLTAAVWIALPIGLAVGAAAAVAAEGNTPAMAAYLQYCSACHGESGKGDGVVAQLMRPKPPDLTQLSKQNGGEFPYTRIMRVIDGRATVRAHGDSDMPVWGILFRPEDRMTPTQQAQVRGKAMLVTDYLSVIQER